MCSVRLNVLIAGLRKTRMFIRAADRSKKCLTLPPTTLSPPTELKDIRYVRQMHIFDLLSDLNADSISIVGFLPSLARYRLFGVQSAVRTDRSSWHARGRRRGRPGETDGRRGVGRPNAGTRSTFRLPSRAGEVGSWSAGRQQQTGRQAGKPDHEAETCVFCSLCHPSLPPSIQAVVPRRLCCKEPSTLWFPRINISVRLGLLVNEANWRRLSRSHNDQPELSWIGFSIQSAELNK